MTRNRLPQTETPVTPTSEVDAHESGLTETGAAGMRRAPRQERSEKRVALILDTFARLVDDVGYAQVSLSLLAREVGMSGPGIYRYFDGLPAVARALATRNQERAFNVVAARLAGSLEADWDIAITRVVESYAEFFRTEPGFRWLRLGASIDHDMQNTGETNRMIVARRISELFTAGFAVAPRPDFTQHVEVAVEITDSLISRAFEISPDGDEFFISETARMVVSYIGEYMERSRPEGATPPPPRDPS
ncbi:TetR/AcrR family transcriptional regulator [Mycetocola tolaasinivorans]|uniref:TetR/AcrR family transcriptional regulator n=1 Tax=Mycetocola tolaasinivorans TaxID=76635 RepID=A0A3L7ABS0_9MICO|nr:TetR/AcrR family transcriptional regulator [Mycetocola tolaasinivorans]RLP76832.1 TetR/AcrR family transcriptional regulator [Mycetocola tolaasinivorans]